MTIAADTVLKALEDEQKRLSELPHVEPRSDALNDFYGGRLIFARCHHSGEPVNKAQRPAMTKPQCWCGLSAKPEYYTTSDKWVEHSRPLTDHEQLERTISILCAILGFDEWSNASVYARAATRDESSRRIGDDGRLARGVTYLAEQLVRRDATKGAHVALKDLLEFTRDRHRGDPPFFTEAGLYDLVGKDDARSILGRLRTLATVMGGVES